jgi:hypothetical protein
MDDIRGKTNCEMHQSMNNISMKVVVGYALPSGPGQLWHGREIRAGYARVGVDAIVPGYEFLDLDIAGPEEETTLGEVLGGVILREKKHIMFPGSAPRQPPSPPSPRNSPPLDDDRDNYQSPSPHRSPPQCQPPPSPPPTHKSQSYGKSGAMSTSNASPKKHRTKKAKAVLPHVEKTAEEIEAEDRAKVKRKLAALRPTHTPKQVYTTKQKKWAIDMLTQPS